MRVDLARNYLVPIGLTASLWSWINFFHDAGARVFYPLMSDVFIHGVFIGSYLNCLALSLGLLCGASLYRYRTARNRQRTMPGPKASIALAFALTVVFYLACEATRSYVLTSMLSFAATALGATMLLDMVLPFFLARRASIVPSVAAGIFFANLLNALCQTEFASSLLSTACVHVALLAVFTVFYGRATPPAPPRENSRDQKPEHGPRPSSRAPRLLMLSIACYGLSFGVMHGMLGFSNFRATSLYALPLLGCAVLAPAFAILCLWRVGGTEALWDRLRGTVFPVTILGYSLFVALGDIPLSTIIIEGSYCAYLALLILGCRIMARECEIEPGIVTSKALCLFFLGYSLGVIAGYFVGLSGIFQSRDATAALLIAIFLVLSLGTFWIGSEQSRRKWWGLRIEKSAEYRHEELLRGKCDAMAERFALSPRETDILFLLLSGMKVEQIKNECSLSIYTVRNHIQRIYRKLNVHSLVELLDLSESLPAEPLSRPTSPTDRIDP